MTIDEAIKILETFENGQYPGGAVEFREAVKLGAKALKDFKHARNVGFTSPDFRLPGETEK